MPFSFRSLFRNQNGGNHGRNRRADPPAHRHSADGANHRARAHNAAAVAVRSQSEPGGPALPNAGVRAGEIIGHRLWWVVQQDEVDWLRSMAHPLLWVPGETIQGNTREIVSRAVMIETRHNGTFIRSKEIWGGVYAYVTSAGINKELLYWSQHRIGSALVCGTVKLWGDVVEHNEGYRGEFAKVHSLRAVVWGEADLEALQRRYFPEPI